MATRFLKRLYICLRVTVIIVVLFIIILFYTIGKNLPFATRSSIFIRDGDSYDFRVDKYNFEATDNNMAGGTNKAPPSLPVLSTESAPSETPPTMATLPCHIEMLKDKIFVKFYNRYWEEERYKKGKEPLAETSGRSPRYLTPFEQAGNNIMITVKTTQRYHRTRVQILLDTWISVINASNLFLVTDGNDEEYETKAHNIGYHYIKAHCNATYSRDNLCCKTGEELSLIFKQENQHYDWICHIDDDIYINHAVLVKLLSLYDPKSEPIYIGGSWPAWHDPTYISDEQTLFVQRDLRYHYAMGGIYCLTRPMMKKVNQWIGSGRKMTKKCQQLKAEEDQTVGIAVELLAGYRLTRTKSYVPHGVDLSTVTPEQFKNQIAVMYGCGENVKCSSKFRNNRVTIPDPAFPVEEDPTRFKSVHCVLHPDAPMCVKFKTIRTQ